MSWHFGDFIEMVECTKLAYNHGMQVLYVPTDSVFSVLYCTAQTSKSNVQNLRIKLKLVCPVTVLPLQFFKKLLQL